MADFETADVKKVKSKKRKVASKDKTITSSSNEQGEVTIIHLPKLVRCSTNNNTCFTKKIFFWGLDPLDRTINGFVLNIPIDLKKRPKPAEEIAFDHRCLHSHIDKENNETILTPLFSIPESRGGFKGNSPIPFIRNTFATLGSFVYSVGGTFTGGDEWARDSQYSGSNLVFYFDTNGNDYSWKRACPMISHRQRPQVVTANGKLYVFGCIGKLKCMHKPKCRVLAEVFDPSSAEWSPISVPKHNDSLDICSPNHMQVTDVVERISAIVDRRGVYQFDIETKSWYCIANFENVITTVFRQPVFVHNTVYFFDKNVHAYDVVKDEKFMGPVQDFSFKRIMREHKPKKYYLKGEVVPAILHLGGRRFCLLGYLSDIEEDCTRRVHCLIIKVSRTNEFFKPQPGLRMDIGTFFLRARVLSCHSYPIDRKLELLDGAVMEI